MRYVAPYRYVSAPGEFWSRLHPSHAADLLRSGLTPETVQAAGVYSLPPGDIRRFFRQTFKNLDKVESALCFPYGLGDFARVKLFPPLDKRKYSQPPGTGARLYIPFPVGSGVIYVVEGEKKTLAGWQHGLNVIGIGGIWNWLSHGQPITDIELVPWEGRDVVVVGDSDIWRRTDLLHAVYALGSQLAERGARVEFLELPQAEEKIGLDDFLVAGGDLAALPVHALGSKRVSIHRPWYQAWRVDKALAQEGDYG